MYSSCSEWTRHLKHTYLSSLCEKKAAGALCKSHTILIDMSSSPLSLFLKALIFCTIYSLSELLEMSGPRVKSSVFTSFLKRSSSGKFSSRLELLGWGILLAILSFLSFSRISSSSNYSCNVCLSSSSSSWRRSSAFISWTSFSSFLSFNTSARFY